MVVHRQQSSVAVTAPASDDAAVSEFPVAGLVRRIRRAADLSQRQLAERCGVSQSVVARAESGQRDLRVGLLLCLADAAGLRLALLDRDDHEVTPMDCSAARDGGGRYFPAHLDTRHGDEDWWHDAHRYGRRRPEYTFDRDRSRRDGRRSRCAAAPADHHVPRAGDSLAERRAARQEEARGRDRERREAAHRAWVEAGSPTAPDWGTGCTCPPGCEYDEETNEDLAHAPECACRCDVS